LGIWFYSNPKNLERCKVIFGHAAAALRVDLRGAHGAKGELDPKVARAVKALEAGLREYKLDLEPLAIKVLQEDVGMDI
jgi:hypothetical protein